MSDEGVVNNLPLGYAETLYWRVTGNTRRLLWLNVLGVPLMAVCGVGALLLAFTVGGLRDFEFGLWEWVAIIPATVLTLGLHELTHGVVMKACGARPEYGMMWHALYATAPGYAFTRNQYLAVIIAPLVVVSGLVVLGIVAFSGMALVVKLLALSAIVNASGGGGDVWMFWLVSRYPASAYVVDEKDGMRVFEHV